MRSGALSRNVDAGIAPGRITRGRGPVQSMTVDGSDGDTDCYTFQFDSADALNPASPTATTVTDRATVPCGFSATYSAAWARIGTLSVEGNCSTVASGSHNMKFDLYKPAR